MSPLRHPQQLQEMGGILCGAAAGGAERCKDALAPSTPSTEQTQSCERAIRLFQSQLSPLGVSAPSTPGAGGRALARCPIQGSRYGSFLRKRMSETLPPVRLDPAHDRCAHGERPQFDVGLCDKQSLFRSASLNPLSHFMAPCIYLIKQ